jgi:hypothetical protein
MKWNVPHPLLQAMRWHPDLTRKYRLEKREHRYALLQNTKGLEALIEKDYKGAWSLIDALVADVLVRAASLSESTPDRIRFGLYIGGTEVKTMDLETVGIEALWTLPLKMEAAIFKARPILKAVNKKMDIWFRGFRIGKYKDIEYGPLLAAAWMTAGQRIELLRLAQENDKKKEVPEVQKMMGVAYLMGYEPSTWNDQDYLAASHGIQNWLERLFFQTSPHQCFWISRINPLIGEWFPDYWQASSGHQEHGVVRKNTLAGLEAMTFPLDSWYSWWSWHSLIASPTRRNKKDWALAPFRPGRQNSIYRQTRQSLLRPQGGPGIDLDIIESMRAKHPEMALAYFRWAELAAATLEPDAGDVRWVQRMWEMYNSSLAAIGDSFPLDGLLGAG